MPVVAGEKRLRIVSDGTARGTLVLDAAGDPVKWGSALLTRIEIDPIRPEGAVTVHLTVTMVGLDVDGMPTVGMWPAPGAV